MKKKLLLLPGFTPRSDCDWPGARALNSVFGSFGALMECK